VRLMRNPKKAWRAGVSNTGRGFRRRICRTFSKVYRAVNRVPPEHGLAGDFQAIVEAHGGTIEVASRPDAERPSRRCAA